LLLVNTTNGQPSVTLSAHVAFVATLEAVKILGPTRLLIYLLSYTNANNYVRDYFNANESDRLNMRALA